MKFKNIKKKHSQEKKKSPSNSRTITDRLKISFPKITPARLLKAYRGSLKIFIVIIFILTSVIVGLDLYDNLKTKQEIDSQRGKLTKELKFWESFIEKNSNYRDAYFQASVLEYKLGNASKAKMYAEKGLSLDPNSENGKKIEELLNK